MNSDIYFIGAYSSERKAFNMYRPGSFLALTHCELPTDFPFHPYLLDGVFLGLPFQEREAGDGVIAHFKEWTVLSFWDDIGSDLSANFVLRGIHTFEDAIHRASEAFPVVWSRFDFPITDLVNKNSEESNK